MRKIAIVTINDDTNFGNRLQNYALQCNLESYNFIVHTLNNNILKNKFKYKIFNNFYFKIKFFLKGIIKRNVFYFREKNFMLFDKFINYSNFYIYKKSVNSIINDYYDFFLVGSDQVWNPNFGRLSDIDLLTFATCEKRVSYAASFGVDNIDKFIDDNLINNFNSFKAISVREDAGKKIINGMLPDKEVEVLIDPTMLLTAEEWDNVSLKPKMLKNEKFILNYFLGELSEGKKIEIERIAKANNCEIINILDKNSPFYECGPSEFLWLEKNAFLICTDSFHSSVFAVLYNRPFIIFDREQEGLVSMNSRLDTLITTFQLKNRKFEGKITEENLNHDYSEAYKILEIERQKSKDFLERALDIKK